MDAFNQKTFTTSRSLTYSYYLRSTTSSKLPILLLHGFPDNAHLWKTVIPLLPTDRTLIVPDLLGYGGTSKPTDPALYNSKAMAGDLAELLATENVPKVIVVGHDWGSFLAQRLYLWHPELVAGLGLVNVAYQPPDLRPEAPPFDLQVVLPFLEATFGYPMLAYWELFTADDGPQILEQHLESLWAAMHSEGKHWMRNLLCVRGALRDFLENNKTGTLKEYAQPGKGWKEEYFALIKEGGYAAPVCWYKAVKDNHNYELERQIPPERLRVPVPVWFLGCDGDDVGLPALIYPPQQQGLLPDLTITNIECGHWSPMEKPEELAEGLNSWLAEKF